MRARAARYLTLLACLAAAAAGVWWAVAPAQHAQQRPRARQPTPPQVPAQIQSVPYPLTSSADAPEQIEGSKISHGFNSQRFTYVDKPSQLLNGYYSVLYRSGVRTSDLAESDPEFRTMGFISEGLKQGLWKTHYLDANVGLDYTEMYKDGLLNGLLKVYNTNGTVRYHSVFTNGNGMWKSFYDNGKPKLTGKFKNGQGHGTWVRYTRTGQVVQQLIFEQGVLRRMIPAHPR